jgi:hypothetical protein
MTYALEIVLQDVPNLHSSEILKTGNLLSCPVRLGIIQCMIERSCPLHQSTWFAVLSIHCFVCNVTVMKDESIDIRDRCKNLKCSESTFCYESHLSKVNGPGNRHPSLKRTRVRVRVLFFFRVKS